MARELKEIEIEEISLVDAASNRKKFYIVKKDDTKKQKTQISINSDGTVKGTKILMGGEEVKDLVDFSFSFYMPRSGDVDGLGKNISCSYSKVTETEDGFKHTDHFYLSKSLEVKEGMKDLKEQLQELLGEDFSEEDFEKAQKKLDEKVIGALKGALNILNKYKGDFPDELKKAVGVLAKHAGYGATQKSKEPYKLEEILEVLEKAHLEKAGAKLSKSTRQQIQKAIDALTKLLELDKKNTEGNGELKKELEEIKDSMKKLAGKLGEKGKDEDVKEELGKITKRLETIEKIKGVKKSIDGDGSSEEKGDKWPSFNLGEE